MTLESKMHEDIRRDEAWLRSVMPDCAPPAVERVKLAARVALHESWLNEELAADRGMPAGLRSRIRERVAAELSELRLTNTGSVETGRSFKGSRSPARLPRWAAAIVGMAACLLFAVLAGPFPPSAAPEFSAVDAFLVYDGSDGFVEPLATLDADIWDLEYSLGLTAFQETDDEAIDDLLEDVEGFNPSLWSYDTL